jgi:hypothetical protein
VCIGYFTASFLVFKWIVELMLLESLASLGGGADVCVEVMEATTRTLSSPNT